MDTASARQSTGFRDFASAGAIVFIGSMLLNASGFGFHAILSRHLSVADYGALYALLSTYMLATIPVGFFTSVIMKFAAEFRALQNPEHVRGLVVLVLKAFGAAAVVYALVSVALARPIAAFLHTPAWTIPLVGLLAAVGILSTATRALGQGVHAFFGYGLSLAGEGIAKVAIVVLFALAGLTLANGLVAVLLGMIAGLILMVYPLIRAYRSVGACAVRFDWARILATTYGSSVLAITAGSIGFADVILVKHFFPAVDSGLYAAASLNGKILLYVVGFIPGILIPQAAHRHSRGERTRDTLWGALAVIACAGVVGVIGYEFFGGLLLRALNGPAFSAAVPLLTPYAGAMAFLALTNALGSYGIATHRLAFALPLLAATAAMFAVMAVVHISVNVVVLELLGGNAVMFLCVALPLGVQTLQARARAAVLTVDSAE